MEPLDSDLLIDPTGVKLRVNYDEEKLTKLAEKRKASRQLEQQQTNHHHHQHHNPGRYSYTNDVYFQQSPGSSIVELKEFDNNIYGVAIDEEAEETDDQATNNNNTSSSSSASSSSGSNRDKATTAAAKPDELDDCINIDIELLTDRNNNNERPPPTAAAATAAAKTSPPRSSISSSVATSSSSRRPTRDNIMGLLHHVTNIQNNKYDNDLYGLVDETASHKDEDSDKKSSASVPTTTTRSNDGRRRTEFEIYVPVRGDHSVLKV